VTSREADFSVGITDNVRKTLRYDWFRHGERRRKKLYRGLWLGYSGTGEAVELLVIIIIIIIIIN
jgi:hypothetical protein